MSWVYILLSIYLIPNVLLATIYLSNGVIGGDFSGNLIKDEIMFISVVSIEIILMILFYIMTCFIFLLISRARKIKVKLTHVKENWIFYFILFMQLSYLVYTQYYGIATLANKEDVTVNNPIKYIFTLFNPDALFLVSLIINWKGNKKITILSIVFIISNFFRGWISGAILQLTILLLTKKFSTKKFKIRYVLMFFVLGLIVSPSIYFMKYVSRDAEKASFERYISYYSPENYSMLIERIFSRFQHVAETYTLVENIEQLKTAEKNKEFVPIYLDNSFRRILAEKFSYNYQTMNEFSAKFILKRESGGNIHTGIMPWLMLSEKSLLIYCAYLFIILTIQYYIFRCISSTILARNYTLWFSMFYLWHGWFFGFTLLFIPSIFFLVILSLNTTRK